MISTSLGFKICSKTTSCVLRASNQTNRGGRGSSPRISSNVTFVCFQKTHVAKLSLLHQLINDNWNSKNTFILVSCTNLSLTLEGSVSSHKHTALCSLFYMCFIGFCFTFTYKSDANSNIRNLISSVLTLQITAAIHKLTYLVWLPVWAANGQIREMIHLSS